MGYRAAWRSVPEMWECNKEVTAEPKNRRKVHTPLVGIGVGVGGWGRVRGEFPSRHLVGLAHCLRRRHLDNPDRLLPGHFLHWSASFRAVTW